MDKSFNRWHRAALLLAVLAAPALLAGCKMMTSGSNVKYELSQYATLSRALGMRRIFEPDFLICLRLQGNADGERLKPALTKALNAWTDVIRPIVEEETPGMGERVVRSIRFDCKKVDSEYAELDLVLYPETKTANLKPGTLYVKSIPAAITQPKTEISIPLENIDAYPGLLLQVFGIAFGLHATSPSVTYADGTEASEDMNGNPRGIMNDAHLTTIDNDAREGIQLLYDMYVLRGPKGYWDFMPFHSVTKTNCVDADTCDCVWTFPTNGETYTTGDWVVSTGFFGYGAKRVSAYPMVRARFGDGFICKGPQIFTIGERGQYCYFAREKKTDKLTVMWPAMKQYPFTAENGKRLAARCDPEVVAKWGLPKASDPATLDPSQIQRKANEGAHPGAADSADLPPSQILNGAGAEAPGAARSSRSPLSSFSGFDRAPVESGAEISQRTPKAAVKAAEPKPQPAPRSASDASAEVWPPAPPSRDPVLPTRPLGGPYRP